MSRRIPLSEPVMAGNEWKYLKECIDTAWVSSAGKFITTFAEKFAEYLEMPSAVPVVNGTAAIHISLVALELKPDEEVLVPALTFAATANAVIYCGASPVFLDIEHETLGLDPHKLETFLTEECDWIDGCLINRSTSRKIRGIIPVHLYGHPANMKPILDLAEKFGLFVVEDATEALGSKYKDSYAGTMGKIGTFSFNGNKLITTGGGGMVVTDDTELSDHIKYLTTQAKKPGTVYYHEEIGYNYRLTNIQAALGLAQLENIDHFISKRRAIAHYYQQELTNVVGITVGGEKEWAWNNHWLSWVLVESDYGKSKDKLLKILNDKGIEARSFFIPLHTLPPYRKYQSYRISVADELYKKGMNIPSHPTLSEEDLNFVVDAIRHSE